MIAWINIWEHRAGGRPTCHATTTDLDAVPGILRAWLDQYSGAPVTACWHCDGIVVSGISGLLPVTVAQIWAEYPDDMLRDNLPAWLDARWRGARRGMTWDTRDGVKRRVGR